ncbi:protein Wnt-10a-like isoform X2 [Watersipora subatra]
MTFNDPMEPTIDPKKICEDYPDLNSQQRNICQKYPRATASAMQGIELSLHECKRQFERHRWNCSNLDGRIIGDHEMLKTGYKESSFTQAVAAAGVLHQIARACSLGKIPACGCERDPYVSDFEWKGCSHDLGFGAKFSRRFLQNQEEGVHLIMQAQNSKVGRKAVIDQKSTKCKCHGLSSSCEIKTCWLSTPDFQAVGSRLKTIYSTSVMVDKEKALEGELVESDEVREMRGHETRANINKNMIHTERSPTYCEPILSLNIAGTSGRVCNSTTSERDSCAALCCGRGYFTKKIRRVEKCNCQFHWCCYVVCDKCEYDEWVTVCK